MAFKKGEVTNPKGRAKGAVNKTTSKVREAIAIFAESNVDKLQVWLDRIAVDDPKSAASLYKDIIEYHIPKLARTETAHEGGLELVVKINYPEEKPR
jgi:hypothetical protein